MSTHQNPPGPVRRRHQHLHEIEFFEHFTTSRRDVLDTQRGNCIRAQLMDPRLQRIVAAAANGWVVERLRSA
jgi:hypothetical protein